MGSGKSTILSYFQNLPDVSCHPEPVAKWTNFYGHNLLEIYYSNQKRWAFPFQLVAQKSSIDLLDDDDSSSLINIYERSIYSNFNVFCRAMKEGDFLSDIEYMILKDFYQSNYKRSSEKFDLIVYLRLDPEIGYQRMTKRGRPEEMGVNKEFMNDLHRYHEDWLYHRTVVPNFDIPILIVDANITLNQMEILAQELHSQWIQK
ncbi:unnamed protein product [Gordionus sp. m RMFG-2023]